MHILLEVVEEFGTVLDSSGVYVVQVTKQDSWAYKLGSGSFTSLFIALP